ncbi:MAG: class I SAM-dependent rRNA methyltransferase [Chloroflexi bacterium]|nr:class I SAM-dependent rRNA methyltransferase [Chloroflexota bacterium]MBU1750657.1 class I SAM-dependent rRNA methyltransferase [Chloroflexota bacterium]MBU1878594.1 class I SAM-dependent rRNA methyltransferase [Chloroflexota bacterium]
MSNVILKRDRDKPVRQRHPWVFSGAIARTNDEPQDGDTVDVLAHDGDWLARGILNRRSQIAVRLLTWDPAEAVDAAFWQRRLARAIDARRRLPALVGASAYRLAFSEADGVPGLVVDRYGPWLAVQFSALAADRWRDVILAALVDQAQPRGIVARDDPEARAREGLLPLDGVLWGESPPARVEIDEDGLTFAVDVLGGQKTGFYLDQRDNRRLIEPYCPGARVLDAFAYTGAFAARAWRGGAAAVTTVESSAEALVLAEENLARNGHGGQTEHVAGNAFSELRAFRAAVQRAGRRFDVVILDPPKFARSASHVERACRGYKDINLLALHLLEPGGVLLTCSCSGLVNADLFQKVVFGAAVDAGRDVQIIAHCAQSADHPELLSFPESAYLKGLLCRVW